MISFGGTPDRKRIVTRVELGVVASILLAALGGMFWLGLWMGDVQSRLETVEDLPIAIAARDRVINEIDTRKQQAIESALQAIEFAQKKETNAAIEKILSTGRAEANKLQAFAHGVRTGLSGPEPSY